MVSEIQCLAVDLANMFLSSAIIARTLGENSYIVKVFCFILSLKYQSRGLYVVFLTQRPFIPGYNLKDLKFHCLHGWRLLH